MDIVYRIHVEKNGVRVGSGPIKDVVSWSSETRLGEAGEFTCVIAATDDQIDHVEPFTTFICDVLVPGVGFVEIGRGEVRDIKTTVEPDGQSVIEVSGPDYVNRLAEGTVGYLEILVQGTSPTDPGKGKPIKLHAAIDAVMGAGDLVGWNTDKTEIGGNYNVDLFYEFSGETVLAALAKLAELSDTYFFLDGNTIKFRPNSVFPDCGIRAIATPPNPDPLNPSTCYIVGSPRVTEETRDKFTRIQPYGYGRGEESISLADLALPLPIPPDGYDYYPEEGKTDKTKLHGIYNINAEAPQKPVDYHDLYVGRKIEKFRKYTDIEPALPDDINEKKPDGTDKYTTDQKETFKKKAREYAAKVLFDTALKDLKEAAGRIVHYDLSLLHLNQVIKPGQSIRCVFSYRYGTGWAKVDARLNITAAKLMVDRNGIRTTDLTVTPTARPPRLDYDPLLRLYAWQNRLT